jgi:hypothetical protein
MAKQTFHGSCKCGQIKFQAALDLSEGTSKCNCSACWKRRWWSIKSRPDDFTAVSGDELLSGEPFNFCPKCGVIPYVHVDAAPWNDGAYVSINVAALDDVDPQQLMAAPVKLYDGRNDNWWAAPEYSAHL